MTKRSKPKQDVRPISMDKLLVEAVIQIVGTFAETMCDGKGKELCEMEAHLYRTLEVNCAARAEMMTAIVAEMSKPVEDSNIIAAAEQIIAEYQS